METLKMVGWVVLGTLLGVFLQGLVSKQPYTGAAATPVLPGGTA
jgi:hypothetical protein